MKTQAHKELEELAASLAEQISRFRDRDDIFLELVKQRIERALEVYEDGMESFARRSTPESPICSYTQKGRQDHRTHYLRTFTGYGFGCDVCGGSHDERTFMTLSIGFHKANLLLDMCFACTKRLVNVAEARIEDKRRK